VDSISWHEAAALANGVSRAVGLSSCYRCTAAGGATRCDADPAHATPYRCPGYRLPTSAELEYATRAGTATSYSSGGDLAAGDSKSCRPDVTLSNGQPLARSAWFCGSSGKTAHEVGRLAPNPWGLYDVHGNVYTWCHDWYVPATAAPGVDPVGADPASGERVTRGGSWFTDPGPLRSAYRSSFPPHKRIDDLGLRLVRSLPPGAAPAPTWPGALALALLLLLIVVTSLWLAGRLERREG
jgi:formylglycine-generating enzyme required for sulfatase activity